MSKKLAAFALGFLISGWAYADTVATVNGAPIDRSEVQELIKSQNGLKDQKDPEQAALDRLIGDELLFQDARKEKLDQEPEVKRRIEESTRQILSVAALNRYLKSHPITEKEIKSHYEAWAENYGPDYRTRHILVMSESEAREIRLRIKNSDDFAREAKLHSLDTAHAKNGGDIGWLNSANMAPAYLDAVRSMKKGAISQPVKTFYGWHIIQLVDSRKGVAPELKDVRQLMIQQLAKKAMDDYLAQLRSRARITRP